jgi:hypothetical protein
LKVKSGKTSVATVSGYTIPESKMNTTFQPVRELWLDYANDVVKLRAFPMGTRIRLISSDDPLNISNHGIWWKDSKWLRMYTPDNTIPGLRRQVSQKDIGTIPFLLLPKIAPENILRPCAVFLSACSRRSPRFRYYGSHSETSLAEL